MGDGAELTSRLIHGDCLEVMPTLAPGSVAMVFADLPYGITRNYWDCMIPLDKLWQTIRFACTASYVACLTATQPFATQVVMSNLKQFKYDLVWIKSAPTGHLSAKKRPMRGHEGVYVFGGAKSTYNPQKTYGHAQRRRTRVAAIQNFYRGANLVGRDDGDDSRYPTSCQKFDNDNLRRAGWHDGNTNLKHPTQKPVALLEWLIKTYTNPGDTVLDPVAGSGTTAIAALRTGRHSICIEKDSTYFAVMQHRVADERAKLGLEAM